MVRGAVSDPEVLEAISGACRLHIEEPGRMSWKCDVELTRGQRTEEAGDGDSFFTDFATGARPLSRSWSLHTRDGDSGREMRWR
jgi:hypothetical protein